MPGRVASSRTARTSTTVSAKSSAQTLRGNTRTSSPQTDLPDEGAETTLRCAITNVFSEAQKSVTGHRKLVISLRKIQESCCYEPVSDGNKGKKQASEEFEEDDFNAETVRCILRILMVKKSEPVGDRVVRFLGTYLKVASDKDVELLSGAEPDAESLPETPTARLTTQILSTLLPLLMAKDKTIRFRATQVTSHIINSLDTLDDGLFHMLRLALLKRIHDKEAPVRLQAVYGLGRLAAEVEDEGRDEDSDSEDEAGRGVLVKLLDILQNDPSAEVRRNLLLNLPLTKEVLPYLLERARDADGATRRALYARLLPALGDFRHLSLTHREKLLRWGLRDRDENVRKATARLFCERWIEDCAALPAAQAADEAEDGEQKPANHAADPSLDALLELLERIDIVNSGVEGGIAQVAMKEFWNGRPDYLQYVSFPDTFWEDLSPELAFVARTFNDFCRSSGKEDGYNGPRALDVMVEEKLPEVTKFGFLLERELNKLVETVRLAASGEDEDADAEEDSVQREFVVEQMLHMALSFDYSDEVGRRKMFRLMREALALAELPEEATRLVVEVLRLVCGEDAKGEREFCGVVLEAVAEVHDTIMGEEPEADGSSTSVDDSFHSATSQPDGQSTPTKKSSKKAKKAGEENVEENEEVDEEKAVKEIMVNMKCLHIAQCMLQNVQCVLEDNVHLVTMLNNLVVPAVRSQEAPIRERGLLCLGLCCLLGKTLAEENLTLFLHCFSKGHPALQTIALQIITDILITHPSLLAVPNTSATDDNDNSTSEPPLLKPILKTLTKSLRSPNPTLQSASASSISKLLLARLLPHPTDLLRTLITTYFDPETSSNPSLRQSLSYFLPVYCHSRASNAALLVEIATSVIAKLCVLRENLLDEMEADEGIEETGLVSLTTVAAMLLDWTDPRRIVGFAEATTTTTTTTAAAAAANAASELHYVLAENVLERLVTSQVSREERKVLFGLLGKLHLPAGGCGTEKLKALLELLVEAEETKVATDATGRNALARLKTQFLRFIGEAMAVERGGGGEAEVGGAEETGVALARGEDLDLRGDGEDDGATGVENTEVLPAGAASPVADGEGSKASARRRRRVEAASDVETTAAAAGADEDEDLDGSVSQLRRGMRDATLGPGRVSSSTVGFQPDAEGTRVGLGRGEGGEDEGDESLVDRLIESSVVDADGDTEMG